MKGGGNWRHAAAISEFGVVFLNGAHRSVNRKVRGSNPRFGAEVLYDNGTSQTLGGGDIQVHP
jgi:hypothetical protein